MRYCIYTTGTSGPRIAAQAAGSPAQIVDANRAEVAWLAARAATRRAYELAEHLVPADPGSFLGAGISVWGFARQAITWAEPDTADPRGELVAVSLRDCTLLPVIDHLALAGTPVVGEPSPADDAVAAVIGRRGDNISEHRAWDHVTAFATPSDPLWIVTADDLDDNDADTYCAVAELVALHSATTELLPGDVVYTSAPAMRHLDLVRELVLT